MIHLFEPLTLRGLTLKNRIVVSPMSLYSSKHGFSDDLHLVHLGRFALGGAGLVMMEAAAVTPEARITHGCNGIWADEQIPNLTRIVDFLHRFDCASGIQLAHSGPKGSAQRPWHGNGPLTDRDLTQRGEDSWQVISSTPQAFDTGWALPHALTDTEIERLVDDFGRGARRARKAGFDVIEIHCAHGYLLHAFLSPLTNTREDRYGGDLENRMRLPLQVAEVVRTEWPEDKPMFVRISAIDGVGVGWSIEDSIIFAKALRERGVDAIDCSTGGMKLAKHQVLNSREAGFQVPFAAQIRRDARVPTIAVGLIRTPQQAEDILRRGDADLIALGREMLFNPNWAAQASLEMRQVEGWDHWPEQYRWWLERRAKALTAKSSN